MPLHCTLRTFATAAVLGVALCAPWSMAQAGHAQHDQNDQNKNHSHNHDDHERARQALGQGQVLPLRTVLEKVEREHQGQVLKIEFEQEQGRYLYKIRLLQKDGRVLGLKVDAVDARVISVQQRTHN